MKKIIVTEERWCCQAVDLIKYNGPALKGLPPRLNVRFCKYCGTIHVERRYMDAAGSMDSEYVAIQITEWKELP